LWGTSPHGRDIGGVKKNKEEKEEEQIGI